MGANTFSGLLSNGSGNLSIIKNGSGQWVFDGSSAHTFTGSTTIQNGELRVNSDISTSSGLTVAAGAILSGTGNLPSIEVFGKHRPGNSPGVQRVQGSASYRKGSIIEWELSTNAIGHRGLDYDGIDVIGDLVFEKGAQLQLVFDDATSEVNWEDAYWTEESPKRWKLFELTANSRVEGLTSLSAQMLSEWKDALGRHFETVHPDKEIQMQLIQETNGIYVELRVVNKANISFHSQETEK
jgi:autotransporter-associated beta strand protein